MIDRKQENAVEENDGVNTLILSNTSPIYKQLGIHLLVRFDIASQKFLEKT